MAAYKANFDLDEADIELIEDTVRNQIRELTITKGQQADDLELGRKIKRLNTLLGKLHNQKIFYSQVNQTGVPLG
ncbi:MAG: hypothetical protein AB8D52_12495 [Gammaproteobacteria bacterium]